MENLPLVSVGIPTYNRPEGLRRTLECITGQTYKNLEIIVSDNCSPDSNVTDVINEFTKKDPRVRAYRQVENIGAAENFKFVLQKATGEYFMWAADDDEWKPEFITTTAHFLINNSEYVAVSTEAQYTAENEILPFFAEGTPFYSFYSENTLERLQFVLKNNYGNLIYGMYRTSVLHSISLIFAYNEIPFFMQIFEKGNWIVLPIIGLFKNTNRNTYLQAKWEMQGGKLQYSGSVFKHIKKCYSALKYHLKAFADIKKTVQRIKITTKEKQKLTALTINLLTKHYIEILLNRKFR
ncbi:MAG TPA: hypothetical protein DCQ31_15960 [Bacteroidales bacterium]|nr:hypothetical protein [Bacteroidales bacterium]